MKYEKFIGAIVMLVSFGSFAGIDLRVGGGLNLSNEIYSGVKKLPDNYDKKMHPGFNAGVNTAIYFSKHIGLLTGLNYETRGSGWKRGEDDPNGQMSADFSLNYLQIPVFFSYRPIPAFALSLGPELGIFLFGKQKFDGDKSDLKEIKSIDFGATLTADYTIANMIAVGAGYYLGFLNNDDRPGGEFGEGSIKNLNIKLFVAYVFHLKK